MPSQGEPQDDQGPPLKNTAATTPRGPEATVPLEHLPTPLWVSCVALLVPLSLLLVVAVAACAFNYGWQHDTGSVRLNVFIYSEVFGVSVLLLLGFAGMAGIGGRYRSGFADGAFAWLFWLLFPVVLLGLVLPQVLGPVSQWGAALARWAL